MKLREICDRLNIDYDLARNALAQGVIPRGIPAAPDKGRHRDFSPEQAFYLAIALKLKVGGVRLATAQQIALWSRLVQELATNGGWDPQFAPFSGKMATRRRWYLVVGDGQCVRIVTNANPSHQGTYSAQTKRRAGEEFSLLDGHGLTGRLRSQSLQSPVTRSSQLPPAHFVSRNRASGMPSNAGPLPETPSRTRPCKA